MDMKPEIQINPEAMTVFCKKHHIARMALFGSALTENFTPDSDLDFLVVFEPNHIPGLIALSRMERELSEIVGRKADLRTPADLSKYFREEVVRTALDLYAA